MLDIAILAWIVWGFMRGRGKGAAEEAYRLTRAVLFVVCGVGLFGVSQWLVGHVAALQERSSGLVGLLGGSVGALVVMWMLARRLRAFFAARCDGVSRTVAGMLGATRRLLFGGYLVMLLLLSPLRGFVDNTLTGAVLASAMQLRDIALQGEAEEAPDHAK